MMLSISRFELSFVSSSRIIISISYFVQVFGWLFCERRLIWLTVELNANFVYHQMNSYVGDYYGVCWQEQVALKAIFAN